MNEIWKVIPGYENYQVSNLGRVKSNHKSGAIKDSYMSNGYVYQTLYNSGKKRNFRVSQLIAMAFLNHKPDWFMIVVDHKDNNKLNNCLDNLQLVTNRVNVSKDRKNKTSKFTGVFYCKQTNRWRSDIMIDKKRHHLGRFDIEEEAYSAYINKLKEIEHNQ